MNDTISEVLQFAKENDVKFIHLAFCDLFGVQKSISIMPGELPRAFQYGISFDASAIQGFGTVERSDLFLMPDSSSVSILPWRSPYEQVMKMYYDIKRPDGTTAHTEEEALDAAGALGYPVLMRPSYVLGGQNVKEDWENFSAGGHRNRPSRPGGRCAGFCSGRGPWLCRGQRNSLRGGVNPKPLCGPDLY